MTQHLGVIGYPLHHTLSPVIQTAALRALGVDAVYEAYETLPDRLPVFLAQLRTPEWLGVNVTVPHKQAVIAALDWLSPDAEAIGAVNTIHHHDGRLDGYNVDAPGFLTDIEEHFGPVKGRDIAVLGAGGAARAVCFALKDGPRSVRIWSRRPEQARGLAEHFGGAIRAGDLDEIGAADILVNCTSAGLRPEEAPLTDEQVPEGKLLYDLIYNPPTTRLMRAVEGKGGRAVNGLGMLVRQAALALQVWTGKMPPLDVMFDAALQALSARASA